MKIKEKKLFRSLYKSLIEPMSKKRLIFLQSQDFSLWQIDKGGLDVVLTWLRPGPPPNLGLLIVMFVCKNVSGFFNFCDFLFFK